MKRILILPILALTPGIFSSDNSDQSPNSTALVVFQSTPSESAKNTIDRTILQTMTHFNNQYKSLREDKELLWGALNNNASTAIQTVTTQTRMASNKIERLRLKESMRMPWLVPSFNPKTQTPVEWFQSLSYDEVLRMAESLSIPKKKRDEYPKPESFLTVAINKIFNSENTTPK